MAEATRTGGRLHLSVREGDGEDVSTHGSAAAPRRYVETYWREPALRSALTDAGSELFAGEGQINCEGPPLHKMLCPDVGSIVLNT